MKIKELFRDLDIKLSQEEFRELDISGITANSQQVKPGDLFIAKRGRSYPAEAFLSQALQAGARAVLSEEPLLLTGEENAAFIFCHDIKETEKRILAKFYQDPSQKMFLAGITGTSGKTTTAILSQSILELGGFSCGLIGTLGCFFGKKHIYTGLTTPDASSSQRLLHEMLQQKIKSAVMEVSSHALVQERTSLIDFDVAVFTNISHEHLDYHGSMENYFRAKSLLFENLKAHKISLVNADDPYSQRIKQRTRSQIFTFGIQNKADIRAEDLQMNLFGSSFTVHFQGKKERFFIPLVGLFNVYNILAAVGVGLAKGMELEEIAAISQNCPVIPGRLEKVGRNNYDEGPAVFVDYAHKPEALQQVLALLCSHKSGRLITVFGCGGERDKEKRPLMAKIAERHSDMVIVTSDNPRKEDLGSIIADIAAGFVYDRHAIEKDRREAISLAMDLAKPEDIILIAGKGHETQQIFADRAVSFDDRKIAEELLQMKRNRKKKEKNFSRNF
ncbi:MAG: UDP-N-acetylmuramoyl-L-alanyl-D-glutamate--2,6-diaminopimelate ligase [Simkaniaceae bacterium]